jgi:hypothetical protein
LSRQFVKSESAGKVLIFPTSEIYLKNNNLDSIDYQTSIDNSIYLKDFQDSTFLQVYYNQLIDEFIRLKVEVYIDEMEVFKDTTPSVLLNVAQIMLEESTEESVETSRYNEGTYYKALELNRIDFNFWFEFSYINKKEKPVVAFDTDHLTDKSDGYFYQNFLSGEVFYEEKVIPLEMNEIYETAGFLASKHAQMIYDILLNRYIEDNYPSDDKVNFLMHYNAEREFLEPIYGKKELFQIIE